MKIAALLSFGALALLAGCSSLLGDFDAATSESQGEDGGLDAPEGVDGNGPGDSRAPVGDSTAPGDANPGSGDANGPPVDACAGDACAVSCTGSLTACEGACVDLTSAGTDCSACGHSCGGGQCMGSVCQPKTLVAGLGTVLSFGIDATQVYYSTGGTISSCPLGGCVGVQPTPLVSLVNLTLLAPAGGNVAFVGNDPSIVSGTTNPESLFACPGAGCPAPPLKRITGGFPASGNDGWNELLGFGPNVYYQWNVPAAMYGHAVGVCETLGGTTCASTLDIIANGLPPIAADAANVYFLFLNKTTNVNDLSSCPNSATCTTPTTVLAGMTPTSMAVYGGIVYYVNIYAAPLGGGPIFTCPITGCAKGTAFTQLANETVADVTADASGVYFTTQTKVYTCPLTGCPAAGPKAIATGQASPTTIRTDAKFVYWLNTGGADAGTSGASIARVAK